VLGVSSDASIEEIKLAYRKRTKALHPDVNPSPNAAESFRRVNRAYAVVSDASRRSLFDLGRDLEARDEGFAPDGETRRRAARERYGSVSPSNAGPDDGYWDDVRQGVTIRRCGCGKERENTKF
jgi:curved DNA-binding protein CbpA